MTSVIKIVLVVQLWGNDSSEEKNMENAEGVTYALFSFLFKKNFSKNLS